MKVIKRLIKRQNNNALMVQKITAKSVQEPAERLEESAMNMAKILQMPTNLPSQIPELEEEQRKPLSWLLMILNMIAILASCFQNGYIIYAPQGHTDYVGYVFAAVMVFDIIVCIYTSCYLSEKWEIIQLYLLLDNILLVCIAASIGFVSFNGFRSTGAWYFNLVNVAFPLDFFLLIGNFRILMLKGQWSKLRIIFYKFVLLICCILFFEIGIYFITVDYSYTKGLNLTFDGQVKELMLLSVFGNFSLIIEMYSKMTDLDHTGQLQSTYELKEFNDNELANNLIEYSQLLKVRQDAEQKGLLDGQKQNIYRTVLHVYLFESVYYFLQKLRHMNVSVFEILLFELLDDSKSDFVLSLAVEVAFQITGDQICSKFLSDAVC